MFGRSRDESPAPRQYERGRAAQLSARGGVSFGPVLTGVVVAFGAMFVLTAIISGILVGLGISENLSAGEQVEVGVATGIGLVVAQFLSYLWGGYAAGRMSRGAGAANGALVALLALVVGVAVGAIATGIGATEDLRTPFNSSQLPADGEVLNWGIGLAAAALVAMFLGSVVGGSLGSRWHTKLERRTVAEQGEEARARHTAARSEPDATAGSTRSAETIDLRDDGRRKTVASEGVSTSGRRE